MIKNYLVTAFRSLRRSGQFTAINIAGLAFSMAVFLFIIEFVASEWNSNRFVENYETLYRINSLDKKGNSTYYIPAGLAPLLKEQFPAIKNYTRIADGIGAGVLTNKQAGNADDKAFRDERIVYVDGSFLNLFSFPLIAGTGLLSQPKTIALSKDMSLKLFGSTNTIGKTVTVSNQFGNTDYTINGVYDIPAASDIKANAFLSLSTLESPANRDGNEWADPAGTSSSFSNIFLQLRNDADPAILAADITKYVNSLDPAENNGSAYLQPLSELHLAPSFDYPFQTYGSLLLVVVLTAIAVIILLIAWLNYINLSTAQALSKAKDTGVRKVLGASRSQLMFQHLTETLLLTLFSALIAVFFVKSLQSSFNTFTGKDLSLEVLNNGKFWVAGITLILVGSLLSGSYVALLLTSFKPSTTIRSKRDISIKGISVRKALVVFQFTTSIVFIIGTVVLYRQLQYMKNEPLGMKLDQLLVIKGPTVSSDNQAEKNYVFKNSLGMLPFVKKYAASNNIPGIGYNFNTSGITKLNAAKDDNKQSYGMFICDQNFFDTYGISFAQGHAFSADDAMRSWNNVKKVIINQKAAQHLGFDINQNIIGQKINWGDPYEIIGVVKDYHHLSLREAVKPTIYLGSVSFSYFTIQTDTKNLQSKIKTLKSLYVKAFPGNPFEYFFADDNYDQQYRQEQQLGKMFIAAACIAIFIACLGLFGLAAYAARQRIKEIGIRKVLGAGVGNITALLSKDFIKLVLIAFILASPVAYWAMHSWLQNFAYRVNISGWTFVLSGVMAVFVAVCTVSVQAIKAAVANPVKSLRAE